MMTSLSEGSGSFDMQNTHVLLLRLLRLQSAARQAVTAKEMTTKTSLLDQIRIMTFEIKT